MSPTRSKKVNTSMSRTKPVSTSSKEYGEFVLATEGSAGCREKVVKKYQQNGVDKTGAFAAAPRSHAQRNAYQHQHQASDWKSKAVVQLDEEWLGVRTAHALEQCAHGESVDGSVPAAQVHVALRAQFQRAICRGECADVVLIGLVCDRVVLGTVAQAHQQH